MENIRNIINSTEFKEYISEVGHTEEGEYHNNEIRFSTRTLVIEETTIEDFPGLKDYKGFVVKQDGMVSYHGGWFSYIPVYLYKVTNTKSEMESDFWSLMEHLNSAENGMAEDFANKYLHSEEVWEVIC